MTTLRAVGAGAVRVGQDLPGAGPVDRPRMRRGDAVGQLGVGQERHLDPSDRHDQRRFLRGRRGERAGMRHPGAVQRADRVVDSGLPLIEGVRRGRGAGPPPGLGDRGGQRRRGVEGRVAGGRSRGHRRLDVAQRQAGALDVGLDLREHGSEVVVAAAAQDQRPVKDRGMDQQVSARLDHQLDAAAAAATVPRGRRRGGAGRMSCVAARAPGGGAPARREGQRDHPGQHDRAPPPPCGARPRAPTSPPGLLPGPGPAPGRSRALIHHRDPSDAVSAAA